MTDVEKATRTITEMYFVLQKYTREDALQITETIYQCNRPLAEEFVFVVELIIEAAKNGNCREYGYYDRDHTGKSIGG